MKTVRIRIDMAAPLPWRVEVEGEAEPRFYKSIELQGPSYTIVDSESGYVRHFIQLECDKILEGSDDSAVLTW